MTLDPRRNGLLTASDFGAACGVNPYCSRQKLFRLKTGREVFEGNDNTLYGERNEKHAIAKYEVIIGDLVTPGAFVVDPNYPTLGATPDGFLWLEGLLEAKCPTSGLYKEIPVYYLAQVIGQLEITGREWCDFIAWTPEKSRIWRVHQSPEAWRLMLPYLEIMVVYIKADEEPPRFKKGEKLDPDKFRGLIGVDEVK